MRIGSGLRNTGSRLPSTSSSVTEMRKSEVVADLFNHQPPGDDEELSSVRVHLSYASRLLNEEFKQNVQGFLDQHRELATEVDKIQLAEEESVKGDLTVRKLRSYLTWSEIHGPEKEESPEISAQEKPYFAIRALDQEQQIQKISQENDDKREGIKANRKKHLPSYYYMVYPETYSFN